MTKLESFLDKLKNDVHVPVALLIFASTSIFHFWKHVDLGANYTNSLYALYAFLGGHAYVAGKDSNAAPTADDTSTK